MSGKTHLIFFMPKSVKILRIGGVILVFIFFLQNIVINLLICLFSFSFLWFIWIWHPLPKFSTNCYLSIFWRRRWFFVFLLKGVFYYSFSNFKVDCCIFPYFRSLCCEEYFQEVFNQSGSKYFINEWIFDGQTKSGPLYDYRYGIDIAVPGMAIVSARSDQNTSSDNCGDDEGLLVLNGTSMSAAVAAGTLLLFFSFFQN